MERKVVKRRFLSLMLALCMVMTMMPLPAFAEKGTGGTLGTNYTFVDTAGLFSSTGEFKNLYDTPQKVVNAAEPGDIVKLLSNVDINETIKVSKKLTLDLNGYVLKMNSSVYGGFASGSVIQVDDGGDLTIIDSNKTVPHHFDENSIGMWIWDSMATEAGAKQKTVNGGVITGGTGNVHNNVMAGGGIYVNEGGKVTFDGGNIVGCSAGEGGGVGISYDTSAKGGTFIFNDGSIRGCYGGWGGGVMANDSAKFIMNGGVLGPNHSILGGCSFDGNEHAIFALNGGTIYSCDFDSCNLKCDVDVSNMLTTMYAHGGVVDANVKVRRASITHFGKISYSAEPEFGYKAGQFTNFKKMCLTKALSLMVFFTAKSLIQAKVRLRATR